MTACKFYFFARDTSSVKAPDQTFISRSFPIPCNARMVRLTLSVRDACTLPTIEWKGSLSALAGGHFSHLT